MIHMPQNPTKPNHTLQGAHIYDLLPNLSHNYVFNLISYYTEPPIPIRATKLSNDEHADE